MDDISNYSVFLVHESSRTLYVGAKDYILALSLDSVNDNPKWIEWKVPKQHQDSCAQKGKKEIDCHNYIRILEFLNDDELFVCGTYSFDPQCIRINLEEFQLGKLISDEKMENGRRKCPFDPSQKYAAVMADGVLYAATVNNFLGTDPLISRATGNLDSGIRTDATAVWLSDPDFVGSAFVRESQHSDIGDDDKIYFFFTETAREFDFYQKVKVPRVARVCKGDMGGLKTLQRRWTSFVKTQLVCADPDSENGIHFNILKDMFTLQSEPNDWSTTVFYGIFVSQWKKGEVSAVCSYSIQDILEALNGKFKEYNRDCEKWATVTGVIPEPRPGSCITSQMKAMSFNTSLDLPDRVLNFIRDHPLMDQPVHPIDKRPILVKSDTNYETIAVTRVAAVSGSKSHYDVLFLGTDKGHIHKAVKIGAQAVILEDITLFEINQPIQNLQLYQDSLYVASSSSVVHLPIANCSKFRKCHDCILARDPLCGWDTEQLKCVNQDANESLLQDVTGVNNNSFCLEETDVPETSHVSAMTGARIVLACPPPSAWSFCSWSKPTEGNFYVQRDDGLELTVKEDTLGAYICHCKESNITWQVASYSVAMDNGNIDPIQNTRTYFFAVPFCLLVGVILGCFASYFCWKKSSLYSHTTATQQRKNSRSLPHTATSSSSPESAGSPIDEQCPLALNKKNGMINGYTGYIDQNSMYCNTMCVDGTDLSAFGDIHLHKIHLKDAPIAHCEESSI